ncbi:hypothetical protein CHS0354_018061, partial [Potamilus streckersoni]
GTIMYEVVGLYPSETFFHVGSDGRIFVDKDLRQDELAREQYTLRIIAFDSAYPADIDTEDLLITVDRNPVRPVFSQGAYRLSVSELYAMGTAVLRVNATDSDGGSP